MAEKNDAAKGGKELGHYYVLKIAGVPGASRIKGYEGDIVLDEWSLDFSFPTSAAGATPQSVGESASRARHEGLTLKKYVTIGAMSLIQSLWAGKLIGKVEIVCLDSNLVNYLTLELTNVLIRNINMTAAAETGMPSVVCSVTYEKIKFAYNAGTDGVVKFAQNVLTGEIE